MKPNKTMHHIHIYAHTHVHTIVINDPVQYGGWRVDQ